MTLLGYGEKSRGVIVIYISQYTPFTHGGKNGCAMILYNTYSSSFVVTISEPDGNTITKGEFFDVTYAELWLNQYLKEHNVEVTE